MLLDTNKYATRDNRSPNLSRPGVDKSAAVRRWVPPSVIRDAKPTPNHKNDVTFRKVRGILNKLTPDRFDKLSLELLNVGIENQLILKGIILLIFDKALEEPKYSPLYAQLCHRLCEDAPNFEPPNSSTSTFRRLLLTKCQDEFENRSRAFEAFDKRMGQLSEDEEEQLHIAKHKMLGNIKFIGELGKLEMVHEGVLHKCIKQLLEKKKNMAIKDMVENLECLSQILKTIGRRLDTKKAKAWMDQYFQRIDSFASNKDLPSRIRFMLQDVQELRRNKWVPRKVLMDNGPKTIQQVRVEAAHDFGVFYPPPGHNGPMPGQEIPNPIFNMQGLRGRGGGMSDMFGAMPNLMGPNIGMGPGVINDSFVPHGPTYSNNMGRPPRGALTMPSYQNKRGGMEGGGNPRHQNGVQQNPQAQQRQQQKDIGNLPPRFRKHLHQQQQQSPATSFGPTSGNDNLNSENVNLRPSINFTMNFKPGSPNTLPKSAQTPMPPPSHLNSNPMPVKPEFNPLLQKQQQITIKPAPEKKEEKKKLKEETKKPAPKKEELDQIRDNMLVDYLACGDISEAMTCILAMRAPRKYLAPLVTHMMTMALEKSDKDRENISRLISRMKNDAMITADQFMEGFESLLGNMSTLESDVTLIKSYVSQYAGRAVIDEIVTLVELSEPMEHGSHYPLFMLCLQQMYKMTDKQWLQKTFNDSKINLEDMLPECDRNKERMMEILEDRGLSFLYPLLRVQAGMWKTFERDPTPTAIYKWIKDNVDADLYTVHGFIEALVGSILRHVTMQTTLGKDTDPALVPDKLLIEQEKQLFDKYKGVLQKFLHDHTDIQIVTLYTLQVFCHSHQFPKGMVLRFFMMLYDLELVDEDVFLTWKEQVNDNYPGKGKVLFQVNQWLTWLEQAEEESDEEDEE